MNTQNVLCFDLWKTLVTEPLSSRDYWAPLFDVRPDLASSISDDVLSSVMVTPMTLEDGVATILQRYGIENPKMTQEVTRRWKLSVDNTTLFPETLEVLGGLRQEASLALMTNTSAYGWEVLDHKYKLNRLFDCAILSFKNGNIKPQPEMFRAVEDWFGPARLYTMVGDSLANDIEPAKARGWQTFWLRRDAQQQRTPTTILSLTELFEKF
ncbi:MAG: HAD family hydrolase [Candidatus Kerfeldbacteria bacterium]|nr:HAD family hydrolase [Candidatus Kerfeldbacteria bacterium]